jgi:transcriptional regulator with XRE-family HTH domain
MTPTQFVHCRKQVLRLDQSQLGDMLGLHFRQIQRYERGITPIPPRITFAMAWIAFHGAQNPWPSEPGAERVEMARSNGVPPRDERLSGEPRDAA